MSMPRTTDEWSERFFAQAVKDIDCHIEMACSPELSADEKYTLRRHIMITLRGGLVGVDHLTDEIDALEKRLVSESKEHLRLETVFARQRDKAEATGIELANRCMTAETERASALKRVEALEAEVARLLEIGDCADCRAGLPCTREDIE